MVDVVLVVVVLVVVVLVVVVVGATEVVDVVVVLASVVVVAASVVVVASLVVVVVASVVVVGAAVVDVVVVVARVLPVVVGAMAPDDVALSSAAAVVVVVVVAVAPSVVVVTSLPFKTSVVVSGCVVAVPTSRATSLGSSGSETDRAASDVFSAAAITTASLDASLALSLEPEQAAANSANAQSSAAIRQRWAYAFEGSLGLNIESPIGDIPSDVITQIGVDRRGY